MERPKAVNQRMDGKKGIKIENIDQIVEEQLTISIWIVSFCIRVLHDDHVFR